MKKLKYPPEALSREAARELLLQALGAVASRYRKSKAALGTPQPLDGEIVSWAEPAKMTLKKGRYEYQITFDVHVEDIHLPFENLLILK